MQYSTLALGAAIIFYALYIIYTSIKSPDELVKLKYMRAKLGNKAGTIIHTLVYSIIPLIFGCFVLAAGINGITIGEFITGRR